MILTLASILILVYFVLMELQMMVLAVLSVRSLRRDRLIEKHGRIDDLLSSDLTPPVSIIVPAYNEAAGIVESVRSMSMLRYAKFEISSGFLDSIDSYAYQSPAVNETAVEEISDPPPAQDSADQPPAPAQDAEAKGEEGVAEVSSADEVATAG